MQRHESHYGYTGFSFWPMELWASVSGVVGFMADFASLFSSPSGTDDMRSFLILKSDWPGQLANLAQDVFSRWAEFHIPCHRCATSTAGIVFHQELMCRYAYGCPDAAQARNAFCFAPQGTASIFSSMARSGCFLYCCRR